MSRKKNIPAVKYIQVRPSDNKVLDQVFDFLFSKVEEEYKPKKEK